MAELNASLGWVYCYPQLVEAQCRLGRFHEAETLVAEQLGPGAAQPWSPAQLKSFKTLQLTVQAYSGQWREAAPGLVALATSSQANVKDWGNGVVAAFAAGDTNAYDRLVRWGRVRYAGNAEAETANTLFWGLILRPQEEDLSLTLPDLLHRVEEGKDYHWSAANLLFMSSQLAYRKGEHEEALRSLDAWIKSKDERALNATALHFMRASPMPDFWRAMILARLGRAEGAAKAYLDGAQKLRAGLPINDEDFTTVWFFITRKRSARKPGRCSTARGLPCRKLRRRHEFITRRSPVCLGAGSSGSVRRQFSKLGKLNVISCSAQSSIEAGLAATPRTAIGSSGGEDRERHEPGVQRTATSRQTDRKSNAGGRADGCERSGFRQVRARY